MARRPASRAPDPRQRTQGVGSGPTARGIPPTGPGPPTLSAPPPAPPPSAQQESKRHPRLRGQRRPRGCASGAGHTDARDKGVQVTRRTTTANRRPGPPPPAPVPRPPPPVRRDKTGGGGTVEEGPNNSPAPNGRKEGGSGVRTSGPGCPPAGRRPPEPGPCPPVPPPPPGHQHGVPAGVTAGTDLPATNPPGCARRPATPTSPGRPRSREGCAAPHHRP